MASVIASAAAPQPQVSDTLLSSLIGRIDSSLLPGDTPFAPTEKEQAARFMLAAAALRRPGKPAIVIETASEERRYTRMAIVNDDMPFLVDSVAAAIAAEGLSIDRLVHPVVPVDRDAQGQLHTIPDDPDHRCLRESMIYIETPRVDARARRTIAASLRAVLEDVRAAVADWAKLQKAMAADAKRLAEGEAADLLRWFNQGMLTQLGHVTRQRDGAMVRPLGICRKSARQILADSSFDRAFAWFEAPENRDRQLLIIKANHISKVHRRVPLDLFIVPVREGEAVTALSVHVGVWTSAALATPPRSVPRLRRQLEKLLDQLDFDANGHAGKALVHAFTSLPHDLLIVFSEEDTARVVTTMMTLVDRPRPRLVMVESPLARHLFAFVWLPRDLLSTQTRRRIQHLLEQDTGAQLLDWSLEVEGGNLALIRFVFDLRAAGARKDEAKIEERLQNMLRGWREAVERELAAMEDPGRAAALASRFADAFPLGYRAQNGAAEAALDILRLRAIAATDGDGARRGARLYRSEGDKQTTLRLKLYHWGGTLPLSDAVPALENFGFHVLTEMPTALDDGRIGTIHDFVLAAPGAAVATSALERADILEDAIAAVLNGQAENDVFNTLVVEAQLQAREANWLRAFYRYLRQAGISFTVATAVDALRNSPRITRALVSLFTVQHDPAFEGDRESAAAEALATIRQALAQVHAINDDRLLRLYRSLIEAILRTNAFAPAAEETLAFKIDSALVPGLPKPLPWREMWVYSRRVEGIHLRSGAVARGGLRWSDRRDDFRTEILGLMKAQRVKNAVIVPTGAKGGFYPKQLPSPALDRAGWAAEGQASYEVFIRSLLSITDNVVRDKVVHPQNVVVRDGPDPYFVVAADKGTARFSDVANAIALERDFWLGDAFASGGSNGYDHKAMGITAKGAWISVQRHFLELGVDVQTDPVRVAGCGDMSGDVFGNGMLLSKAIKLVAAFDHRHIFIDPDPDPAHSWQERQRLFNLPTSSWADYDASLISDGGGVYPRDAKLITLSPAAQATLGVEQADWEPEALISAILKAPVDLLWFGGIGTYLKAAAENNAAVGDPANDALRVNGEDVRAKVIGEGANLGLTQAGRIEFALNGGRLNTDFIDNSAGVDCSDNEVNIKIALAPLQRSGKLSQERRNALLEEMTEEVAQIVLEDNRDQALALSIAERGGADASESYIHLINTLEGLRALDRHTEGLAENDVLGRRAADGRGLTRPELAVLLSSAKLLLQDHIERDDPPIEGPYSSLLLSAFPRPMQQDYAKAIQRHRLRREIVATKLANRIVNRLGILHPFELAEEEGASLGQVAAAYLIVETLLGIDTLWEEIEAAAMPEAARLLLLSRLALAMRAEMADLLRTGLSLDSPTGVLDALTPGVTELGTNTRELLAPQGKQHSARILDALEQLGAPSPLGQQVAHLFDMDGAIGVANLARNIGVDAHALAAIFIALGEKLGLDWAQGTAAVMNPSDVWERLLVAGLARDFQQLRLDFLRRVARRRTTSSELAAAVSAWMDQHAQAIERFRSMIERAQREGGVTAPMLAQIASMARNLLCR
ncbi:NAD-glutamate dehydrogenase domain-containing protein [Porphyrobacter sp. GA68]|uniref:NAD-glutamate dehydrogenase n=1 Tax=Porphyrobacter sp. GA68 TaxID=2883480 RepID=UPI001D1850FC|nr:NAD-glutamate dehydrogenase domain-containing protein [Porphyrobacter sp. GA68]